MLSIQVMEAYAKRNQLTGHEVKELFHKHQVFEKILLQHEYLHQVDFEEAMEYVNKVLRENPQELILFHGSVTVFNKIELEKSHNRRDFGKGFYTTILRQQAKEWAYRLSLREHKDVYYVYQFVFEENDILKIKHFDL